MEKTERRKEKQEEKGGEKAREVRETEGVDKR